MGWIGKGEMQVMRGFPSLWNPHTQDRCACRLHKGWETQESRPTALLFLAVIDLSVSVGMVAGLCGHSVPPRMDEFQASSALCPSSRRSPKPGAVPWALVATWAAIVGSGNAWLAPVNQ